MLHQILDLGSVLLRQTVACGIGDVNHSGTCLDNSLDDPCQVFVFGATCILGVELHVLHIFLRILHGSHCPFNNLLAVGVELIFNMGVAGTDTRVNTLALGILQTLGCDVDIFLHGTCQGTNGWPCHRLGNLNHRIEVARTGNRESCLNHIHAQLFQLLGHLNLFYGVQLTPWYLLSVT